MDAILLFGDYMNYNDKVIVLLKSKYDLCNINIDNSKYLLFSIGKEKDKNYIILENDSTLADIINIQKFIDSLTDKRYRNASFVYITFVKEDLSDDDYLLFNGSSFLHIFTYNLITLKCKYDIDFHYFKDKKIKEIFKDLENLNI